MKANNLPMPHFLTVPEVGKICGVSRNTVYNWVKKGALDAYQTPGRTNLIRPGDLIIFMQENGMFVPDKLKEMATEDAALVGFTPKSEVHPRPVRPVVLFIDDSEKERSVADRALHDTCEVLTAATGYEGLHLLTTRNDISLVFVDLELPGLSGTETISQVLKMRPSLKVVEIGVQELPSSGIEEVFSRVKKPLRLDTLRKAVKKATPQNS